MTLNGFKRFAGWDMFSRRPTDPRKSLSLRLTFWYMGTFFLFSCVAFFLFYMLIISLARERTDRELAGRMSQLTTLMAVKGRAGVERASILEAQAAGEKLIFFRLLYSTGDVFFSSNMSYWQNIGVNKGGLERLVREGERVFETIEIPGRADRVRILYDFIGRGIIVQLGQSREMHGGLMEVFTRVFVVTMGLLTGLATLIGWFMVKRALSGVSEVTKTARKISDGDLRRRVPVKGSGDEIDLLATTFNRMLDRIDLLVKGIREMSDNIAHDLKSPVTRIRGIAEVTLTTGESVGEYEAMAGSTIEECDRLLDMINTMLVISRTEAGEGKLELTTLDVGELVNGACDLFLSLAEEKSVALGCEAPPGRIVEGDLRMLQRMIANLLDNAIKYTGEGGRVAVTVDGPVDGVVRVIFEDSGTGIDQGDLPHVFERFYRCDRSRSSTGTGLGLCLARTVARAHGGNIEVASTPGIGSTFTVELPEKIPAAPLPDPPRDDESL